MDVRRTQAAAHGERVGVCPSSEKLLSRLIIGVALPSPACSGGSRKRKR